MSDQKIATLSDTFLGKFVDAPSVYSPDLLCVVQRHTVGSVSRSFFQGYDLWCVHELSWLTSDSVPARGLLYLVVPSTIDILIESKSAKLYFSSLRFCRFSDEKLVETIRHDFSAALNTEVGVFLFPVTQTSDFPFNPGKCLDQHATPFVFSDQVLTHCLSASGSEVVKQRWYTSLFLTHCPVTHQPDLGTIVLDYEGPSFDPSSLMKYLVSFRSVQQFNETCCDITFHDIYQNLKPQYLMVAIFYMRRGGINLTPFRMYGETDLSVMRDILGPCGPRIL